MKKTLILLSFAALTSGFLAACNQQSVVPAAALQGVSADDLLVVDCLLPGQVRQLGSRLTYVSARRPIQTSVHDCQIRGGEYVAYDRADYNSALAMWRPLAEQGDPDAQNKIGEIYERGLAGEPDMVLASAWYRKAAGQGHTRAQINLGFLYEKGLGVDQDSEKALSWYRKASQLPDAVMIDRAALDAQQARIEMLKSDLDRSRVELERARKDLRRSEQSLQQNRKRLQQSLPNEPAAGLSADQQRRLAASRKEIEKQRIELVERQERIRELEQRSRRQQDNLLLLETEGASQRQQLELVRTQLQRTRQDLKQYQDLSAENERQLSRTKADIAALKTEGNDAALQRVQELAELLSEREAVLGRQAREIAQREEQIAELSRSLDDAKSGSQRELTDVEASLEKARRELLAARVEAADKERALEAARKDLEAEKAKAGAAGERIASLEVQLNERERILGDQKATVERLRKESGQLQQKVAKLEQGQQAVASRATETDDAAAPPSIQLIDPPLLSVRGAERNRIAVKRGLKHRTVIGRVTAPAGLYSININGIKTSLNDSGLFETDIRLSGSETPVSVVAVDRKGRRTTLAFSLVSERDSGTLVAKRVNLLEGVKVGGYHALVIGNQDYESLPDLDTAVGDAEAVANLLTERFGFKTTLLRNANRYEILSALNRFRKELTEDDNLLVYYAGHGELDRVNLRGHWLPTDAEAHNTANWISNVSITDILNAMSVRHVLMIADSCYSGALTRSSLSQIESGKSEAERAHWLKTLTKMRSRTAMTSGGLAPVLDGGGGGHSVFAKSLLAVLRDVDDITEGQRIYREVSARVAFAATKFQVEQVPEYAPIKYAGHESGDFLFIPKAFF